MTEDVFLSVLPWDPSSKKIRKWSPNISGVAEAGAGGRLPPPPPSFSWLVSYTDLTHQPEIKFSSLLLDNYICLSRLHYLYIPS